MATNLESVNHKRIDLFWVLVILTTLELAVFYSQILPRMILISGLIVMAFVKASFVALRYMNLGNEKKILLLIALIPVIMLFIMLALLGWDTTYLGHRTL